MPNSAGAKLSAISSQRSQNERKARVNVHRISTARRSHMRRLLTVMVAALVGLAGNGMAAAQGYPTHAITMIVPFPAGGAPTPWLAFWASVCAEFWVNP